MHPHVGSLDVFSVAYTTVVLLLKRVLDPSKALGEWLDNENKVQMGVKGLLMSV